MRQLLFYLATVLLAGAAIFGVLSLGASLPLPVEAAAAVAEASAAAAVPGAAGAGSLLEGLQANLGHPLSQLFIQLLVVLVAARLTGYAFTRIGIPAVVGEMTAGILLGPSLFGLVAPAAFAFVFPADSLGALRLLSQVGICLFMFAVGMELNVAQVRSRARSAVAVSHTSIVVPFLLGVALAYPLFSDMAGERATFTSFALFMGISMSITAFPVLARILQERGLTRTHLGNTAITCAAVEDVTAWLIMAFVVAIARATSLSSALLSLLLVAAFIAVMSWGVRPGLRQWLGDDASAPKSPPAPRSRSSSAS